MTSAVTSSAVNTTSPSTGAVLRPHLFMLQTQNGRLTTLERRDEIESALTNTEKIVANLLAANSAKQVVLKERTPNCFVVL